MSVIGRLDEGVEAVLINPIKQRQTPAAEKREGSEREESTPPLAPPTEERDAESPAVVKRDAGDQASLPVWLL